MLQKATPERDDDSEINVAIVYDSYDIDPENIFSNKEDCK
jgi:hypothetical protein